MLPAEDQLDLDLIDAMAGLITRVIAEGEQVAKEFAVPPFFMKALHLIDGPLAMKELGQRMHCDPSFVTGIADMLEKRGLAVREPDPADRRVKRLVLTDAGREMKHRIEQGFVARAPWRQALTVDERRTLLSLLRKMAPAGLGDNPCRGGEEMTDFPSSHRCDPGPRP